MTEEPSVRLARLTCPYCHRKSLAIVNNMVAPVYYQVECLARDCGASGPRRKSQIGAFRRWLSVYGVNHE